METLYAMWRGEHQSGDACVPGGAHTHTQSRQILSCPTTSVASLFDVDDNTDDHLDDDDDFDDATADDALDDTLGGDACLDSFDGCLERFICCTASVRSCGCSRRRSR